MTQPRYEFWRPITPVEGEPIPDGAGMSSDGWQYIQARGVFRDLDRRYHWRVPVEVIPLDVAVEAVCSNATVYPPGCTWSVIVGNEAVIAGNYPDLVELVRDALRKAAQ